MSSEDNLCSPLLERLLKLEREQQHCRLLSNDYLSSIKSPQSLLHSTHEEEKDLKVNSDVPPHRERQQLSKMDAIKQDGDLPVPVLTAFPDILKQDAESHDSYEQKSTHRLLDLQALLKKVNRNMILESLEQGSKDEAKIDYGEAAPKFSYLKKGQGTSRFNVKPLKGFKSKTSLNRLPMQHLKIKAPVNDMVMCPHPQKRKLVVDSASKEPVDQLIFCSERPSTESKAELIHKKQSRFEKLEKLVDHESFCSTSSTVMELLHDETTFCSTPVSTKTSFIATMEITPILKGRQKHSENEKGSIEKSPVRQLFPFNIHAHLEQQSSLRQTQNFDYSQKINDFSSTIKSSSSGILKKRCESVVVSPSLQKVKFLERGAKVLEYEDSELDTQSLTACSDDSDLVNLSDLENLALLNYNVNVVYEDTLLDDTNNSLDNIQKTANTNVNVWKANNLRSEIKKYPSSQKDLQMMSASTNLKFEPELSESSLISKSRIPSSKSPLTTEKEDLETKAHKLLLLSKVDDLNKEVNIFKAKNKSVEQLIAELKVEKENLIKKQKEIPNMMKRVVCTIKPKNMNKGNKENVSVQTDALSTQLKELNDKLRKLEVENAGLKRKVTLIERRGKAMEKDRQETKNVKESEIQPSIGLKEGKRELFTKNKVKENCARKSKMEIPSSSVNKKWEQNSRSNCVISKMKSNLNSQSKNEGNENRLKINNNIGKEKITELKTDENRSDEGSSEVETCFNLQQNAAFVDPNPHDLFTIEEEVSKENNSLTERNFQIPINPFVQPGDFEAKHESVTSSEAPDNSISIVDIFCRNEDPVHGGSTKDEGDATGVIHYPNGDTKTTDAAKVTYKYAKDNVTHTTFKSDGREEIDFPNGQKEIYFPDSSFQLIFADNSSKSVYKDGAEICVWKDGTVTKTSADGTKSVHFPNGQKEVHERDAVTRIYPDGTRKTLHADGRQETRYTNGKVRVKDPQGNVAVYECDR